MCYSPHKVTLLPLIVLALTVPTFAQKKSRIAKIEFTGLNRISAEELRETTGLKIGQAFDVSALDAAAQRLADSGLFKNVAYRTRANGDQITITFQVEETKRESSRVIFDNFIWFTDTQLIGAVRREVPTFSGTAPDSGDTAERITKALQRFLHEHQIEAIVNYMTSQDSTGSQVQEHIFSVTGVPMPICTLHFPGAGNVSEAKLIESSRSLPGNDYSSKLVTMFAVNNLFPIYREAGQLKAAFSPPSAKPQASATCKNGVELIIPVDEGPVYKWDKALWTGMAVFTAQTLDASLGMQQGQPANGVRLDKAIKEIQRDYRRKGYLMAQLSSVPEFDDNANKVAFKIDVREGLQYRMGKLITRGFSESATKMLHERWGLKTGMVFDQEYSKEFSERHIGEILKDTWIERRTQGKPAPKIKWGDNVNRETLTVDVMLDLTNQEGPGPPEGPRP